MLAKYAALYGNKILILSTFSKIPIFFYICKEIFLKFLLSMLRFINKIRCQDTSQDCTQNFIRSTPALSYQNQLNFQHLPSFFST